MRRAVRSVIAALVFPLALLCAPTALAQQCPCIHFGVSANPATVAIPRKMVLLPSEVAIFRGAQRDEDLIKSEKTDIEDELRNGIGKEKGFEIVALPSLNPEAQALVNEHIVLFDQVAGAALSYAQGSAPWPQKVARFDYSIGDGLRFLKQSTGADAALIVLGTTRLPTGSDYAIGALTLLVGVISVPRGSAVAVVGVVDLDTGNIIWLNRQIGVNRISHSLNVALRTYPDAPAGKK